jgi:16S rRNA (cytosine1402-N4)-methyltransferase
VNERTYHRPVLTSSLVELLRPESGGLYVDCTLGTGGHSEAILEASSPDGRLVGIDQDREALEVALSRLKGYSDRFEAVEGDFAELRQILAERKIDTVDGIIADLGVSSLQLEGGRGFSFRIDAPLDMRMSQNRQRTAGELVNELTEGELSLLLRRLGDETLHRQIARAIVRARSLKTIETTRQLAEIAESAYSGKRWRIHPATRTMMALRIAVNRELESLEMLLEAAPALLAPGGTFCVISYHSLEDGRTKRSFARLAGRGGGEFELPVRKPIVPSKRERESNPRSRSAKLRAIRRSL